MKKVLTALLLISMLFSLSVSADAPICVLLDGQELSFDVNPEIITSRTMVPMRAIFTALGANVDWVEEHRLIVASKGTRIITMMIDKDIMHIGDLESGEQKTVALDSPPVIVNSRTLVPVRAISDALGVMVDWNGDTRTVILNSNKEITSHEK